MLLLSARRSSESETELCIGSERLLWLLSLAAECDERTVIFVPNAAPKVVSISPT